VDQWIEIEFVAGSPDDEARAALAAIGFDPSTADERDTRHAAMLVDGIYQWHADMQPLSDAENTELDGLIARQPPPFDETWRTLRLTLPGRALRDLREWETAQPETGSTDPR
jgi:hypothetical protein